MIDQACPEWASAPCRFLAEPFYIGGRNSQIVGLVESPFAFRRRLVVTGRHSSQGNNETIRFERFAP